MQLPKSGRRVVFQTCQLLLIVRKRVCEGSPALHWDSSDSHLDTACQILGGMCELYRVDRKSPAL